MLGCVWRVAVSSGVECDTTMTSTHNNKYLDSYGSLGKAYRALKKEG